MPKVSVIHFIMMLYIKSLFYNEQQEADTIKKAPLVEIVMGQTFATERKIIKRKWIFSSQVWNKVIISKLWK